MLYRLQQNEAVQTIPTVGFNVETVKYRNISFVVWDVGGQDKPAPKISYVKGFAPWGWVLGSGLYVDHVLQADQGVDLDFLVGKRGAFVPRDNH